MSTDGPLSPRFSVSFDGEPPDTLLVGTASVGLAGLTAIDYLVDHGEWQERGAVRSHGYPQIVPFADGRPRAHTRIFNRAGDDLAGIIAEVPILPVAAAPFAEAVVDWMATVDVDELLVPTGVPMPHGPEQHDVYHVVTDDALADRCERHGIEALGGGFLDGLKAELVDRVAQQGRRCGVLLTPVHYQYPDIAASVRLVEAIDSLFDLEVDAQPLRAYADEQQRYFTELSQTMEAVDEREHPADRMYM